MERVWIFNALQVAVTVYAVWRGGAPERLVGVALLVAAMATRVFHLMGATMFVDVEIGIMTVDLVLLGVMIAITLTADRFWPAWVTALHALGTGAHLAKAINPDVIRLAYAVMSVVWSYPILILLIVGTLRHSRRIRSQGRDLDWSRQDPTMR